MEITEEINLEEKDRPSEEKKGDIFFSMLNGKTVKETVNTSRGDFIFKFPKQKDLIAISRIAAFMRSGIPAANFDAGGDYEIQKCATLDVMVESGPQWFNQARKKDPNFSWGSVPDAGFVDEVYAKALSFRQRVQNRLKGIEENSDGGASEDISGGVSENMGDGVFSGVAGKATGSGSKSS
jgi:hypothetical protein